MDGTVFPCWTNELLYVALNFWVLVKVHLFNFPTIHVEVGTSTCVGKE